MVKNVYRLFALLVFTGGSCFSDPIEDKLNEILLAIEFQTGDTPQQIISELQALHAVLDQSVSLVGTDVGDVLQESVTANEKSDNRDEILEEIRDAILALSPSSGATNGDIQTAVNSVETAIDNMANGADLEALRQLSNDQLLELTAILLELQDFKTSNDFNLNALLVEVGNFSVNNSAENQGMLLALQDIKDAVSALEGWWSSNYMTGSIDTDDDVPTLIEIRELLYNNGEGLVTSGSSNGQDVVLGTRNNAGEFEGIRDEIDDLDVAGSLSPDYSAQEADLVNMGTPDASLQSTLDNTFSNLTTPVFMLHHAKLETHSPLADYGVSEDILGGMAAFGIPSITDFGAWFKACVMLVALWVYYQRFLEMSIYYGEMDMKSTPTQPVTNYGGALGGIINLPVKLAQLVMMVGVFGGVIAVINNLDQVDGQSIVTTIQVLWGTVVGTVVVYPWLTMALQLLDTFIPASFVFQLWFNYISTKVTLVFILWISTKGQRALS